MSAQRSVNGTFVPTFEESRSYFENRLGVSLPARDEVSARCPFHDDNTASMSISLKSGTWYCHACACGGGILDFERRLTGREAAECWSAINATIGREGSKNHKAARTIADRYDYHDADGKLVYQVARYASPKDFRQRRPNGKGGWIWNIDGITRVPFGLPLLVRANVVLIAEGEKDALNLRKAAADFPNQDGNLVYAATTNAGGAGKWLDEYSPYLAGKKVFVFADNDDPGRKHALDVAASVAKYAQGVHLMELTGLAEHGDVSDYLRDHTPAELFALMQAAPRWTPSVAASDPAPRLTANDAAALTGRLLEMCRVWILRFVVLGTPEATVLAFWLLHTWAFAAASTTPYIHVRSPEKESGKTTLLKVLKAVARSPRFSSTISASALGRVVAKDRPTLFLDELDAQMKGDRERAQDIRGVLDGGFEITGTYTRCVGNNFEVVDFPTFSPKVLAGIGELWDTVESRAIPIDMRRRLPSEAVESFRQRRVGKDAAPITQALQDWANSGVVDLLESIEVADVPGLGDRQMDISEPLLQIAGLAGPDWTKNLVDSLQSIFKVLRAEDGSTGAILLSDIREIFAERKADHIRSKELAAALCEIEGRPWPEWSKGRGLSANNLASLLKKYNIFPGVITPAGETSFRGYERFSFEDAWKRYCPSPPIQTVKTSEPASLLNETPFPKCKEPSPSYGSKIAETRMDTDSLHFYGSEAGGKGGGQPQEPAEQGKEWL